jgi:Fur family ferric uptake transcriptional regulator
MNHKTDVTHMLRTAGLKVTTPRIAILSEFIKHSVPLSALEIQNELARTGSDIVTVYRTLSSFEKAKLLRKVDLRREAVYYELTSHHHHHIVCTHCGEFEDVQDCSIEIIGKKVLSRSKKFNHITDHALEFFGVCRTCIKE